MCQVNKIPYWIDLRQTNYQYLKSFTINTELEDKEYNTLSSLK